MSKCTHKYHVQCGCWRARRPRHTGRYIAYASALGEGGVWWSNDLEELKYIWSFTTDIFESAGLTYRRLKKVFPEPPPQGTVLHYLKANLTHVYHA